MRATIPLSHLQLPSRPGSAARLADFVSLMKPRVMLLAVFTALVGLMIAPGHLDPLLGSIAILAIAAGAGAAGVLNMWYDADIDAVMARTAAASNSSRHDLALRSAGIRTCPCRRRSRGSCARAQYQGGSAARLHDLLLRRRLHGMAEAEHAAEHRHWRCRRCPAAGDWLGSRHRRHRARAAHLVPDRLPMDAAALLGALAQSCRRICPRRRSHAAGRCRKGRNNAADPRLQSSSGAGFDAAVGARVCRRDLRRDCRRQWSDPRCARGCNCAGAVRPIGAPLIACSHSPFSYLFVLFAALLASNGDRWSPTLSSRAAATVGSSQAASEHDLSGSRAAPPV